ncbi:hypothetical protein OW492_00425 [Psychromonas sp. 14N.309.X.WAT.B.A12]|uniref:hypothetical protein n=1 Tax=Psychromonas sp. 14N.309.X.WAT.B.A12 TaxID=2998322 RepID=UPI0025AFCD42|nr:hypothetical protein [Psychromonas sp. 14N.309.X.WAT.B.A12]MDN2661836.1 hypothetical protein [Psychromonas sp. 14N.309.X.WAT.B.A12]
MKKIAAIIMCLFSFNSFALGVYDSLGEPQKTVLKSIVSQLGLVDKNNSIKTKIYNMSSYVFDGGWNSKWFGLDDLSGSRYVDGIEKGFIEVSINHAEQGTIFITYIYKPETKQIIVFTKQVRHGPKNLTLQIFEDNKSDKDSYVLSHEGANYALLQAKGLVNFQFYNIQSETGSLVYVAQGKIDL